VRPADCACARPSAPLIAVPPIEKPPASVLRATVVWLAEVIVTCVPRGALSPPPPPQAHSSAARETARMVEFEGIFMVLSSLPA